MANETLLVISGEGVAPWSARGIKQSLTPIDAAKKFRRTVNMELVTLSPPAARLKYVSKISCEDTAPPAFDALEIGDVITVDCISELSYKTLGGSPAKTVVSGSSRVEGAYTRYRPQITFKIVDKNQDQDEWDAKVSWGLDLEEV
jgi:hypothetical protein